MKKDINEITWEEIHPNWADIGDMTEMFAKSQFDDCPGCGTTDHLQIASASEDILCVGVVCTKCSWQVTGDTPSDAINKWNLRKEDR